MTRNMHTVEVIDGLACLFDAMNCGVDCVELRDPAEVDAKVLEWSEKYQLDLGQVEAELAEYYEAV